MRNAAVRERTDTVACVSGVGLRNRIGMIVSGSVFDENAEPLAHAYFKPYGQIRTRDERIVFH